MAPSTAPALSVNSASAPRRAHHTPPEPRWARRLCVFDGDVQPGEARGSDLAVVPELAAVVLLNQSSQQLPSIGMALMAATEAEACRG